MKSGQYNPDSNFANYITSCYFAFGTLTTVGYGDIRPETNGIFLIFL
jgi:voltage-gated potassium channel Kch